MSEQAPKKPRIANLRPTRSFGYDDAERQWLLVDAKGKSLGRLASQVSKLLRGKHKPTFTPHTDAGDFVVIVNAAQVEMRGNDKINKTVYNKHTGYLGNMKSRTAAEIRANTPAKLIELAVAGMIPRGSLGNKMMKKLKIYGDDKHPHHAQKPQPIELKA
ncbi:MAG: 50S ribosomal protein L13 [Myxococcota bacterium]